jgi:trehalose 6-phosphate synthase/phosphatase
MKKSSDIAQLESNRRRLPMQTLINVSNRLPVTIGSSIEKSSGGLVAAMEGVAEDIRLKWIGWAGGVVKDPDKRRRIAAELRERFNYVPIFLSKDDAHDYYTGFSNSSLWPLLHYNSAYARYSECWYEAYQRVNRIFAEAVLEQAGEGDLIWIHDYHLMLLPAYLREYRRDLKIGFFLHTPFPSSEIFRCHPDREALLEGLLGADLIGFHTFGYLRHFRSTVLRLLNIESEMNYIVHNHHRCEIGVYPIGINSEKFKAELQSPAYRKCMAEYQEVYKGKKMVLSVERLDYTKGIPRRLDAIEDYLSSTGPRDDIVFIFISVPSRKAVPEYQSLLETVRDKVSHINGKYATIKNAPVHFINKSIAFSELCALYSLADVAMVTPFIDGMNLVAKEYVACQQDKSGVLILSEFAGAAQELPTACVVNPYNIQQMAECLKQALELSEDEKRKKIEPMKERVLKYDARYWANSFMSDLTVKTDARDLRSNIRPLTPEILDGFFQANPAALFLDYDGTLADLKKKPVDALPDDEIAHIFSRLRDAQNVDVFIISGRRRDDLDQHFSGYGFKLVAEHGYFYRPSEDSGWLMLEPGADLSWKNQIAEVFAHFSGMTPGSSVEEKASSVVWHYRESDPEFGSWKASHLVAVLVEMMSNLPVVIQHGKKIVEVSSMQVSKGVAMQRLLREKRYNAVLCAGDDETDESMFRVPRSDLISVKIGEGKRSSARYVVPDPAALRELLMEALRKMPEHPETKCDARIPVFE